MASVETSVNRTKRMNRNIAGMLLLRGMSILVSIIYVPLLLKALSAYDYGVWLTITSLTAWVASIDIGLGNGLRNKLAAVLANENVELAREYISTAYAGIFALCLALGLAYTCIGPYVDWHRILNAQPKAGLGLGILMHAVVLLALLQLSASTLNSVLFAVQSPAKTLLLALLGQLMALAGIGSVVALYDQASLSEVGLISAAAPPIVLIVSTFLVFKGSLKRYCPSPAMIRYKHLKSMLGLGLRFFALQIITIITYSSSSVILAHTVGPEGVAEYNLAYKYIGLVSIAYSVVVTPYWSASTDAYARGDIEWLRSSVKRLQFFWAVASLIGVVMIFAAPPIYRVWALGAVKEDPLILTFMLVYFVFSMLYASYGYVLNGIGKIRLQLIVTSAMAIMFLPLAFYASLLFGIPGILGAMIVVGVVNSTWSAMQFRRLVEARATGVWNE